MNNLRGSPIQVLVLSLLAKEPMYGLEICKQLGLKEGSVYPVLHGIEEKGLAMGEWQVAEKGPVKKYYRLTEQGGKTLEKSAGEWMEFCKNMLRILGRNVP